MSTGFRNTLLVLAASLLLGGLAGGLDHWLEAWDTGLASRTVAVIARERAAQLSERSLAALEMPDPKSRRMLREKIQDILMLSEVLSSVVVVDREGRILASEGAEQGRRPPPSIVFGGQPEATLVASPQAWLNPGRYVAYVPLLRRGEADGYLELAFRPGEVETLHGGARRRLLLGALAGLAGVLLLGVALQAQLSRRAAVFPRGPEAWASGSGAAARPEQDLIAQPLAAASRVSLALNETQVEGSLEQHLDTLAQFMSLGLVLLDEARRPLFANARGLELLGVAKPSGLTAAWPQTGEVLLEAFAARGAGVLATRPLLVELPVAGGSRRLQVEWLRLSAAGRRESLLLLSDPEVLDVLERDMRLASQVDSLARVYRTLAHELKAPLAAMMIHLDLLRASLAFADDADPVARRDRQRYAAVLRGEVDRLNRSLAELLTESVPSNEGAEGFDLRAPIEEVGTLLAPQARKQGVELSTRLPPGAVMLVGYRDRLKQALLNVAVNALEAMPKGGRLEVEMAAGAGAARIAIADTGPGIPSELLGRIDERDFTTKGAGGGLGLHVAQSMVSLHGGQISVHSVPGEGTRVEIRLPLLDRG